MKPFGRLARQLLLMRARLWMLTLKDGACPFPQGPAPTVEGLLRVVLAPAGSAPGADNEPYELYHVGAHFVALLLGQALLAMAIDDSALACVAGPALDLLLWIPKEGGCGGHWRYAAAPAATLLPPVDRRGPRGHCGSDREASPRPPGRLRSGEGIADRTSPWPFGTLPELIAGRLPEVMGLGMACWAKWARRYGSMLAPLLTRYWPRSLRWSLRISPKPLSACPMLGLWRC